jgi:hypothetical protein
MMIWVLAASSVLNALNNSTSGGSSPEGFAVFFLLLSFYWTSQVLKNIVHVTCAGTFASWYFLMGSPAGMPANPTVGALKRASTTSLGSICFGSFIVAVIKTLRAMVQMGSRNRNCTPMPLRSHTPAPSVTDFVSSSPVPPPAGAQRSCAAASSAFCRVWIVPFSSLTPGLTRTWLSMARPIAMPPLRRGTCSCIEDGRSSSMVSPTPVLAHTHRAHWRVSDLSTDVRPWTVPSRAVLLCCCVSAVQIS